MGCQQVAYIVSHIELRALQHVANTHWTHWDPQRQAVTDAWLTRMRHIAGWNC